MTITKENYLAACREVYKVRAFDERLSSLYAEEIVKSANVSGAKPHFGGGVDDHRMGKLGELVFEHWLWSHKLEYSARCRCPWGAIDHTDYLVDSPQGRLSMDVKSGRMFAGKTFEDVPIEKFGLQVPVEQVGENMPVIYPYVLFDSLLKAGVLVGFAYRFDVATAPVENTYHSCHRVPISSLRPVADLLKLLCVSSSVESLEKLSLARS